MRKKQKKTRGFTLVELIVTLAILAILAAFVLPSFRGYMDREQEKECRINRKAYLGYLESMRALDPEITMAEVISKYQDEIECPGGGTYEAADNNTVRCTKHGEDASLSGNDSDGKLDNEVGTEKAVYTVTVYNGTADVTSCTAGTTVTVRANEPQEGKKFSNWAVVSGTVSLADASASVTTFTMPEGSVTLEAKYENLLYTVSVENGRASTYSCTAGTSVQIMASSSADQAFVGWEVTAGNITLGNSAQSTTTFTMPYENVSVKAVYKPVYLEAAIYKDGTATGMMEAISLGAVQPSSATLEGNYVYQNATRGSDTQVVLTGIYSGSAGNLYYYSIDGRSALILTGTVEEQKNRLLLKNTDIRLNYEKLEKNYTVTYTCDKTMGEVSGPTALKSQNEVVPLTFTVTPEASFEVKSVVLTGTDGAEATLEQPEADENGTLAYTISDVSDYMGGAREGELKVQVNFEQRAQFTVALKTEYSNGKTEEKNEKVAYNGTWSWTYETDDYSSNPAILDLFEVNGVSATVPSSNTSITTSFSDGMKVIISRTSDRKWNWGYKYKYTYTVSISNIKSDLNLKSYIYESGTAEIVFVKIQGVSVYYCQDINGNTGNNLNAAVQQIFQGNVIKMSGSDAAVFYVKPDAGYEARFSAAGEGMDANKVGSIDESSYNGKNTAKALGCTNEFHYSGVSVAHRTVFLTGVPLKYSVSYNLNSGTPSISDTNTYTVEDGSNIITVSDVIPKREGYVFAGWDLGGRTYYVGDRLTVCEDTLSLISGTTFAFQAKWETQEEAQQVMYTVEYYLEQADGTYHKESKTYLGAKNGQAIAIPLEFEGYVVNLTNSETVQIGNIKDDGSLVLKLYYERQEDIIETPDT